MIGKGKKYIQMFQPTKECRLKWSELVVYSYLAYQDVYGDFPPVMRIVRATGLARNTVKAAVTHLGELGLIQDQQVKPPFPGWFATAKRKDGDHWRDSLAYWRLLVRDPSSELTPIQAGLLCYLWHCTRTNYAPRNGWSIRLLAILFRAKRETIKAAFVALQESDFLRFQIRPKEGIDITILTPTDYHLANFQNTAEEKDREEHFIVEADELPDVVDFEAATSFGGLRLSNSPAEATTDEEWFARQLYCKTNDKDGSYARTIIESDLWKNHKNDLLTIANELSQRSILDKIQSLVDEWDGHSSDTEPQIAVGT